MIDQISDGLDKLTSDEVGHAISDFLEEQKLVNVFITWLNKWIPDNTEDGDDG